ncbi:sulfite exporter TauE/SafE family protein [Geotalea sp. SG265]|uniref:sulfite exporter TauE/SafE family protein n=1 Tax=Geotalea sp. SG265 TaxID=2922867 RepID=UPI001FAF837E|nr:sulfite exporter TauE/SafE family protein [Geotalea sp. SG265]
MNHALVGLMGGLLAFPHCMGMCGGFMIHLSRADGNKPALVAQAAWLAGKMLTYTFAGAVAGYAGLRAQSLLQHTYLQNVVSYAAGAVIFLAGLSLLGVLPRRSAQKSGSGLFAVMCRPFLTAPSPGGAVVLGMITGLLPCPIIVGFLAYAMQSASVTTGMTTLAAVGIGTILPLLALGGASLAAGARLKRWGASAGGIILVLVGLATGLRGTELFHHLLGCPSQPIFQQPSETDGSKGCCAGKSHGTGSGN